ncbi:hypothetical protein GCM10010431_53180 [Streptomyces kunmingensis]
MSRIAVTVSEDSSAEPLDRVEDPLRPVPVLHGKERGGMAGAAAQSGVVDGCGDRVGQPLGAPVLVAQRARGDADGVEAGGPEVLVQLDGHGDGGNAGAQTGRGGACSGMVHDGSGPGNSQA